MYRAASLIVAGVALAAGLVVFAAPPAADPGDDPPLLKKKGAPDADDSALRGPGDDKDKVADKDKKPDAPKPDGEKLADKGPPPPDPKEVLKDVAKSMRSAEEHLAKKEVNDSTRQAEEDALKGLDKLIDLAENPPDDPDNKDQQKDQANQNNKNNQDNKNGASQDKPDPSRMPGSRSGSSGPRRPRISRKGQGDGGRKPGSGDQASGDRQPGDMRDPLSQSSGSKNGNPGDGVKGSNDPKTAAGDPNADLNKDEHTLNLSQKGRQDQKAIAYPDGFMPEYESLIKQYLNNIAEKDRKDRGKGD